jgi:hypothetical protein
MLYSHIKELFLQVVPAERFYEITRNKGVGLTFASMGMPSFGDCPADGTNLTGVGEIRLMPDMSTLLSLAWYISLLKDFRQCYFLLYIHHASIVFLVL